MSKPEATTEKEVEKCYFAHMSWNIPACTPFGVSAVMMSRCDWKRSVPVTSFLWKEIYAFVSAFVALSLCLSIHTSGCSSVQLCLFAQLFVASLQFKNKLMDSIFQSQKLEVLRRKNSVSNVTAELFHYELSGSTFISLSFGLFMNFSA